MDSQRAAALSEGSCVLAKSYRGRADRHQSMGDPDYPGIQARDRPRQVPRTGAQSCNARCGRRRLRRSCRLLRAAGARTDSDRDHNKTNGNSGSEHGLDCPSHAPRQTPHTHSPQRSAERADRQICTPVVSREGERHSNHSSGGSFGCSHRARASAWARSISSSLNSPSICVVTRRDVPAMVSSPPRRRCGDGDRLCDR